MQAETGSNRLDYAGLCELAKSRNIHVVEAEGIEDRTGIRFSKDGEDWIAVRSDLSDCEKQRALGFLLESPTEEVSTESKRYPYGGEDVYHRVLRCPKS